MGSSSDLKIRMLCSLKKDVSHPVLHWLIGFSSHSSSEIIIASTIRCLHTLSSDDPFSPHIPNESDELRSLLPRGFQVIGAFILHHSNTIPGGLPTHAISAALNLRKTLYGATDTLNKLPFVIGAVSDLNNHDDDVQFFVSQNSNNVEIVNAVVYELHRPDKFIWDRGCLIRCQLKLTLPLYYSSTKDVEVSYAQSIQEVEHKLRDPQVAYIFEAQNKHSPAATQPAILHGADLDQPELPANAFSVEATDASQSKSLACSYFCSVTKDTPSFNSVEEFADKILVSIMFNRSRSPLNAAAPTAEYYPVNGEAKLVVVHHTLEILAYATKDQLLTHVISNLIIPGLVDQLYSLKNKILPYLLIQQPLLRPYHFMPSGFLHPITVLYELSYGETEMKQVEVRKTLHLRLGLPFDRPLLRIANALNLSLTKDNTRDKSNPKGSTLLKDVHLNIPSSGVSGGNISLIQGSYEYYHYLQDGFNDSGWGCAYRSLQTIISWFRQQHYTAIDVPSHREIQQALVEIGDKDPSFVGSREWIGAIELSFVLDKLLGVSCKVITMRSGAEFPEKCREIASHFKNQGTPIMIGGGVLAYTLLGVDYNDVSGDCAFLILDPHYTGNEVLKKIVNGGWCGWKKAVDSKGKPFFLHDKFYNLLLPQRPSMV